MSPRGEKEGSRVYRGERGIRLLGGRVPIEKENQNKRTMRRAFVWSRGEEQSWFGEKKKYFLPWEGCEGVRGQSSLSGGRTSSWRKEGNGKNFFVLT